jgi:molecular chaperone DnaK
MDLIIFDLDMTLVDTSALSQHRKAHKWKYIESQLNLSKVYPGILDLIQSLKKDHELVIVTSSPESYARSITDHHNLGIDRIVAYHDTAKHKPHPDPLLEAIEKYADQNGIVIHVGDNIVDIQAASEAKVDKSFLATWGVQRSSKSSMDGIEFTCVDTPQNLLKLIQGEKDMTPLEIIEFEISSLLSKGLSLGYYFKKNTAYYDQISISIREYFKTNDANHVDFWTSLARASLSEYLAGQEIAINHVVRVLGSNELTASGTSPLDTLGEALAAELECSFSANSLSKSHATRPLKETGLRSERETELKDVYSVSTGVFESGDVILLIDDICTSGTTAKTISSEILKENPTVTIILFVLAKTSNPAYGTPFENRKELISAGSAFGIMEDGTHHSDEEENRIYKYAIGLDLGTTNSLLAYRNIENKDAKIEYLPIDQPTVPGRLLKEVMCPSVVYYHKKDSKIFIGRGAEEKKYSAISGIDVFYSSKSLLGQKYIFPNSKHPELIYPYQVSSQIVEYLLAEFTKKVHPDLNECKIVVTVPASFGGSQRTDTLKAISEAGIEVQEGDLTDEPNAAFIGYLSQNSSTSIPDGSNILIFDMGGGTTDISIVELLQSHNEEYDVKNLAISRYDLIGGDDIDHHFAFEHLFPQLLKENNIGMDEWSYSVREKLIMSKLRKVARALKEALSEKIMWHIHQLNGSNIDSIPWESLPEDEGLRIDMPDESFKVRGKTYTLSDISLDMRDFKRLIAPFIDPDDSLENRNDEYNIISVLNLLRSLELISMIPAEKIDYILFVGGSTLNPFIIDAVHKYYSESKIISFADPEDVDRIVAYGAVIFAEQIARKSQMPIIPIVPDKIGILIKDGEFISIIPGGVQVPFPIGEGDFKYSEPLNLPSSSSSEIQIPICVGSSHRIYQTIRIPREQISGEVEIGLRVTEGKTLQCNIRHLGESIELELNNPVSVYSSDDVRVNNELEALYEHRNAVVKKLADVEWKALQVVNALIDTKKIPQAREYAKSLIRDEVTPEIKTTALFKLAYTSTGQSSIDHYIHYLRLKPDSSAASFNLGIEYTRINKSSEADKIWQKSIRDGYASNEAYISLAALRKGKDEDYKKLASDGVELIKSSIETGHADDFSFYWIIKGYELLGMSAEVQKWKRQRDQYFDNKYKVYDNRNLLEADLMGVDAI